MKPAIIVVDMVRDNVATDAHGGIGEEGRKIIPSLQQLLSFSRARGIPVVFANDSFFATDFIFTHGRMKPHALRGTDGCKVIPELDPQSVDIVVEKRRFSAFFKTDLDITLRGLGIDTVVVTGIATEGCVLISALDGVANDFRAIILEDCCASFKKERHDDIINYYRKGPFSGLFKIVSLPDFLSEIKGAALS